jgi:hypothetical protein
MDEYNIYFGIFESFNDVMLYFSHQDRAFFFRTRESFLLVPVLCARKYRGHQVGLML